MGVTKNLSYGPVGSQMVDIFLPKHKKGEPLLIFIHGGAWVGGDKGMYAELGNHFSDAGYAVALINYRLSPSVENPEHVKDASMAYAWLVGQAGRFGYDPTKIFVSGHSAGAHNAGMMATGTFLQDAGVVAAHMPAGFIGLEGIYDVPALNKRFPSYKNWFLAKAFGDETKWAAGSPTLRPVTLKTRWLIIQSTQDPLVDVPQAEGFAAHLKKAGVPVELWIKANGNHDEATYRLRDSKNGAEIAIRKFMDGAH
jgi:acetyl esterase/lipase